ncbi:GPW/gp25 family protein [uncultured Demequina sp.]|uniref:GPW/gp25 family protein n=1 Tax=uncultured Demequina sp. TaxID=693499 RepID=UPI0025D570C9|nr:GPW/gp25 family protein [uncultured Demequina sp.]
MSAVDYPHVGRGWAFPPRWEMHEAREGHPAGATLDLNDGVPHVQEAMRLVLRTSLGERVMRPTLGAGVDRYVFESRTVETCHRLAHDVERALLLWEPRVIVDGVTAVPAGAADDRIDVRIDYRIDRHRRPDSLIVPFYVEVAE